MTPWPRPSGPGGWRRIPAALGVTLRLLGLLFTCVPILGVLVFAEPAAAAPLASEEVLDAARAFARVFDAVPALSARARGEAASVPAETLPAAQQVLRALEREEGTNPFFWAAWGIVGDAGQDAAGAARAYRRASELAGNGLAARWRLLKIFQALGREEEARQEWQQLRRLRLRLGLDRVTFIADELTFAARAFAAAGQGEAAEQTVALAAEFDPVSADVHLARAGLLL
ncbi:MAG: hypothetical protein HY575_01230, partial [candidate division NC10 bacterium]|nr:hypothetical protein [candidate division NC10 bacterium]